MAEEYTVEIGVRLKPSDMETIKTELSGLNNKDAPIEIHLNTASAKKEIEGLKTALQSLGKIDFSIQGFKGSASFGGLSSQASQIQKSYAGALSQINLTTNGIKQMNSLLSSHGVKNNDIQKITNDLKQMNVTVQEIRTNIMSSGDITMNIKGVDEFGNVVNTMKMFEAETGNIIEGNRQIVQSFTDVAQAQQTLSKINFGIEKGSFQTDIDTINQKFNTLNVTSQTVKQNLADLNSAFATMSNANAGDDARLQAYREYNQLLPVVKKQLTDVAQAQQTLSKSAKLDTDIQTWMNNNAKAAERYGAVLKELQHTLRNNTDPNVLRNVGLEFSKIKSEAQSAGLVTKTFGMNLKQIGMYALGIQSSYMAFQKVVAIIKEGINVVKELDTALIDLKKTTTMSASDLTEFYYSANEQAKQLGVTTQEIIQSAADWSRLGYSDKESASQMADLAAQFNVISPGTTIDESTKGLVSVMKAYGIETENVLDGIMSKINIVGNTAATSNKEILEGLTNSSSAMAAMNSTLDENIALFTAGQEIAQNAGKVGNALRSISLRIRGKSLPPYTVMYMQYVYYILMITISVNGLEKLRPRKD